LYFFHFSFFPPHSFFFSSSDISGVQNIMAEICEKTAHANQRAAAKQNQCSQTAVLDMRSFNFFFLFFFSSDARGPVAAGVDATALENYTGGERSAGSTVERRALPLSATGPPSTAACCPPHAASARDR